MTKAQEDALLDFMNTPEENREKVRALIPELERLAPGLVEEWLKENPVGNSTE